MPTKPEGPAQEQCPHCGLFGIHAMSCQYVQFAATPAPSQPAGAREIAEQIVGDVFPSMDATCTARYVEQATKHIAVFLAQQTAAKDTEIERLTRKLESAGNAAKRERDRAEDAERERDSLRAENAALKAGKRDV